MTRTFVSVSLLQWDTNVSNLSMIVENSKLAASANSDPDTVPYLSANISSTESPSTCSTFFIVKCDFPEIILSKCISSPSKPTLLPTIYETMMGLFVLGFS